MTDNSALSMIDTNIPIKNFGKSVIQTGSTVRMDFGLTPLTHVWIKEGNPAARSIPLARAEDNNLSLIVEENGATYTLKVGDVAFFPEGLETVWTVPKYVKKFAIFRSVREPFIDRVYFKLKNIVKKFLGKK